MSPDRKLVERIRRADPAPPGAAPPKSSWTPTALLEVIDRRSADMDTKPDLDNQQRQSETYPTRPERNWRRPLVAAAGAAVVIVAVIVAVVVANRGENRSVAEEPPPVGLSVAETEAIALAHQFWQAAANADTDSLAAMPYAAVAGVTQQAWINGILFLASTPWGGEVGDCRLALYPEFTGINVECTLSYDHALVGNAVNESVQIGIIGGRLGDFRPPSRFAGATALMAAWVERTHPTEFATACNPANYLPSEAMASGLSARGGAVLHPDCGNFIASHLEEYMAATGGN